MIDWCVRVALASGGVVPSFAHRPAGRQNGQEGERSFHTQQQCLVVVIAALKEVAMLL